MDAFIYLAMGNLEWEEWSGIDSAYDVNIKGLHFLFRTAAKQGITQAVYCSSMSVYSDLRSRYFPDEEIPPDETELYGFTKWMGEQVCRNAWRRWGCHVNALRLCHPTLKEKWLEETKQGRLLVFNLAGLPSGTLDRVDVGQAVLKRLGLKLPKPFLDVARNQIH